MRNLTSKNFLLIKKMNLTNTRSHLCPIAKNVNHFKNYDKS